MAYEWMIWKMLCPICNMLCAICKMLCVVCNIISMKMHVSLMAWLSQFKFGNLTHFPNPNLESSRTFLIMLLIKSCFYLCMSLVCACIYPYLVQVSTNPTQFYNFRCRHKWTLEVIGWHCSYPYIELSSELGRPSCFRRCLPCLD